MHHRKTAFRSAASGHAGEPRRVAALRRASSSSADPNTLLKQTFSGSHKVNSGDLNLTPDDRPSGSSMLSGPITLSFGGPFQSPAPASCPSPTSRSA